MSVPPLGKKPSFGEPPSSSKKPSFGDKIKKFVSKLGIGKRSEEVPVSTPKTITSGPVAAPTKVTPEQAVFNFHNDIGFMIENQTRNYWWLKTNAPFMLRSHAEYLNKPDTKGETALQKAKKAGAVGLVLELIAQGADIDPNAEIIIGERKYPSPLLLAVENLHPAAVKKLLDKGAKVNVKYGADHDMFKEGNTPLHIAAAYQQVMHDEATLSDNIKIMQALLNISTPEDVNMKNSLGQTPLHLAATSKHADMTKLLLQDQRVNPNIQDAEGRTPLILAASEACDFPHTTELLVNDLRVDKNAKDKNGRTALHHAVFFSRQRSDTSWGKDKLNLLQGKIAPTEDNFGHLPEYYLTPGSEWYI